MAYPSSGFAYFHPPYFIIDPLHTTYVPKHYPEKHYPLEHFRHAFGHTLSNAADEFIHPFGPEQPIHRPSTDVRESKNNYYVEVELPGLESKDDLKIKWLSPRTFMVETKLQRPKIVEGQTTNTVSSGGGAGSAKPAQEIKEQTTANAKVDLNIQKDDSGKEPDVFLTVHERRVGQFARAFSFATEVSHEKLEATLHAGLLRIKVPKRDPEDVKPEHREEVKVNHSGA